jgi:NAD(P)H-dependent flavin oxidoreductase YrpB (nitropropane dioxygenase family)
MFSTSITRTFKLTTPIVNAGMAMIARPALAAAVCEAGGLGTIGSDINPPDVLRDLVRRTKTLTKRPFGVDLIGDFVTDEHVSVLIEEQVALAIFFWTLPTPAHVERLKQAGIKVWMQIGRVAEAEQAAALGADALIVQGAEAGGHNRAEASTMTLFPRIRRRFPGLPLRRPCSTWRRSRPTSAGTPPARARQSSARHTPSFVSHAAVDCFVILAVLLASI